MKNLLLLFWSFAKVGLIGYGGGPAMIPLVQADVVDVYKWMDMKEFTDTLAMGYALPGPISTKVALAVGYRVAGILGSIFAVLGVILPSAILIMSLVVFFTAFKDSPHIKSLLKGIRPVILAMLLLVVFDMTPGALISWQTGLLAVVTFFALMLTNLHPAIAIVIGGIVGLVLL